MTRLRTFLLVVAFGVAGSFAEPADDLKAVTVRAEGGDVKAQLDLAKANWTKAWRLHPTGATGHPAQPSGNASAQQGADLLQLVEYRQRKSEPGKFAFVPMPHIHQGYNNCGSTASATFARFQGSDIGGWDYKRLCPSPRRDSSLSRPPI